MQVHPIKPTLKPPGTYRLKLDYDEPLSSFAFNFNLRHSSQVAPQNMYDEKNTGRGLHSFSFLVHISAQRKSFLWDRGRV